MGLDVIAWERLEWLGPDEPTSAVEDAVCLYPSDDFERRADGLAAGWYRSQGRSHEFRAGSYSTYNRWRELLAALVGTTTQAVWSVPVEGPFVELIDFSDADGAIGGVTSQKLAHDFADWSERAELFARTPDARRAYFIETYRDFRQAFTLVSVTGAVLFS